MFFMTGDQGRQRQQEYRDRDEFRRFMTRRINLLLRQSGMSQADLARASGLGKDSISLYCRGKVTPRPKAVKRLACGFGLTIEEFLAGAPEESIAACLGEDRTLSLSPVPGSPNLCDVDIRRRLTYAEFAQIAALLDSFEKCNNANDGDMSSADAAVKVIACKIGGSAAPAAPGSQH